MDSVKRKLGVFTLLCVMWMSFSSCMTAYKKSVGGDGEKLFSRIFLTDFRTAWSASVDSLKSIPLETSNREAGVIQTRWVENTAQKNFIDSFGTGRIYLKAQYRFQVTIAKGFYDGKPSIRVSVLKDQLVKRDVLDGWSPVVSDSIDENTLLYRIGRLIYLKMKLAKIEEDRTQEQIQDGLQDGLKDSLDPEDTEGFLEEDDEYY